MSKLVTGGSGFLGRHLVVRLMADCRFDVYPVSSSGAGRERCDLGRPGEVLDLLRDLQPAEIYHCVGSFSNDWETDYRANVVTTYNLLEGVRRLGLSCRVLLIGSCAEYGIPQYGAEPITEDHPLVPVSVYGLTKMFQTQIMGYFQRKFGLNIVMARLFNLDGEGISPALFPGRVREQIGLYLEGRVDAIRVGDLSARRDYLPVEDAVSDLTTLMAYGTTGEIYNVGSGTAVSMKDFLQHLLSRHGLDMESVRSEEDRGTRSSDVPVICADVGKMRKLKAEHSKLMKAR